MKKQFNEKQLQELNHINDWCLTILNFMIKKYGEHTSLTMFKDVINDGYNTKNLRGMRSVYRDTNEWGKGLNTLADTEELNQVLYAKFSEDLNTCSGRDAQKIKRIVRRGKISTENEFRLVLGRVDEIYTDDTKKEEIKILNKMLGEFELSRKV
ncbi:hypothetical protein AGMMS50262_18010 [Bacteroidia bacterium]|nr:hypothetical protein AGMMS50262_18010 [Bacteroidia bacterium]